MTDLLNPTTEQAHVESDLGGLALSVEGQNLLFREAQTAYSFTDEPVTDAQLEAVYELSKWGPTAMNSQPLRIVLVQSQAAKDRLLPLMAEGNRAKTAAAPVAAILAADLDFHDELHRTFPGFPGARDRFLDEEARSRSAHLSAGLQVGYFIVAVRAAGLATGPMGGFDADGVSREFFPDGRHRALLVVNLGHAAPDSFRPRQPRLDYADVVSSV